MQFNDGSSNWINLEDSKQTNPVELAKYYVANGLAEDPAFKWWVKDVLKAVLHRRKGQE